MFKYVAHCFLYLMVSIIWNWCDVSTEPTHLTINVNDSLVNPTTSNFTSQNNNTTTSTIYKTKVNIATIIPSDNSRLFAIDRIRPVMEYAIEQVHKRHLIPDTMQLVVNYNDSHCNTKDAPIAAFNFYMHKSVDVFIGPVCDYSLAPVARYSPYWNIPVITPGGFAHDFGFPKGPDSEFPLLTRIGATFNSLANAIIETTMYFKWSRIKVIYVGDGRSEITPRFCFLAGSSLIFHIKLHNRKHNDSRMDFDFFLYTPGDMDIGHVLQSEVGTSNSGECM